MCWPGPQIAWLLGLRAERPVRAECWSLTLDGGAGGSWVSGIQLSALPTILMALILISDRDAAGGWPLVRRAALAFGGAALTTMVAREGAIDSGVSNRVMSASLPLVAIDPLALNVQSRRLTGRVAHQRRQLASFGHPGSKGELPTRQQLTGQAAALVRIPVVDQQSAGLMVVSLDQSAAHLGRHGQAAGEAMLTAMTNIVKDATRSSGVATRWCDTEFALLLPRTDADLGTSIGELIRRFGRSRWKRIHRSTAAPASASPCGQIAGLARAIN